MSVNVFVNSGFSDAKQYQFLPVNADFLNHPNIIACPTVLRRSGLSGWVGRRG